MRRRRRWGTRRLLLVTALAAAALLMLAPGANAHPLGNFTVNSFSGLRVEPHAVEVQLVVDSAEIPTVQQFAEANAPGGVSGSQADAYAVRECRRLQPGLRLTVAGERAPLTVRASELRLVLGQGSLQTMRLTCELRTTGSVDTVDHALRYVDQNSLDRTGWRELTAVGNGVDLAGSTVAAESVSNQLTDYPQDLLSSPLDDRSLSLRAVPGTGRAPGAGAAPVPAVGDSAVGGLTASFTDLVAERNLSIGFAMVALLLSVGLGALHAFAPGHGKTLMAAYLLGQQHSIRQVAVIGLTVTLTHTAGVLVLGVVLSAVAVTAPASIYGWLGIASGVLLVGIGGSLLRQARRRAMDAAPRERAAELVTAGVSRLRESVHAGHGHEDAHGHVHGTGHTVTHAHGWGGVHSHPPPATSARGMVAVGFAGGLVPSPSALIVLLGGIALGRTWFGVLLVLAYGVGMAGALVGTGLALAHARDRVEHWARTHADTGRRPRVLLRLTRVLPKATAMLVIVVGVGLALRSLLTL